ncbi:MAG: FlgD immunoglobulin-like domain containing protein [Pseudomonadota bacterium]
MFGFGQGGPSGRKFEEHRNQLKMTQETYFKILMAQFKYQDPTQPMKPEAIAEQMMTMGQSQQLIELNEQITKMANAYQDSSFNSAINLIGKSIVDDGGTREITYNEFNDKPNPVMFSYKADKAANDVRASIYNHKGQLVKQDSRIMSANPGVNSYYWDGKDDRGNDVPEGHYTLRIGNAGSFSSQVEVLSGSSQELVFKFSSRDDYGVSKAVVKDSKGKAVYERRIDVITGHNEMKWNGILRDKNGHDYHIGPGIYHLEIQTPNASGVSTKIIKTVSGILPVGESGKMEVMLDDNSTKTMAEITNVFVGQDQLLTPESARAAAEQVAQEMSPPPQPQSAARQQQAANTNTKPPTEVKPNPTPSTVDRKLNEYNRIKGIFEDYAKQYSKR